MSYEFENDVTNRLSRIETLLTEFSGVSRDHESRIRNTEKKNNMFIGVIGFIAAVFASLGLYLPLLHGGSK